MKDTFLRHILVFAAFTLIASHALRAQTPTNQPPAESKTPVATRIIYRPPLRGAPAVRVDGGSRGSGVSLVSLTVLAPNHAGYTTQEQPSLFWYQSAPANVPFELTLIVDKKAEPVLQVKLPEARKAGIQCVKLSDHNVKLTPGVQYEWVVALVADPDNRSKDVVASGFIERIAPPASLAARLANAGKFDLPTIYAEEGIWYDAIEALSNSIDAKPDDRSLRSDWANLLQQVGLTNAATYITGLNR